MGVNEKETKDVQQEMEVKNTDSDPSIASYKQAEAKCFKYEKNNLESYKDISTNDLLKEVMTLKKESYVLSQILAVRKDTLYILYSFEKGNHLLNLRLVIDPEENVESINKIFTYAYLYENELKDLFGVNIVNLDIDFHGNLYTTKIKTPFKAQDLEEKK